MPNNYFKFKQFTLFQGNCAMKVTTDGCLFGAILAEETTRFSLGNHMLDIGTGTGLLALMVAQKNPQAFIDAVEIDEDAARQAASNIKNADKTANVYIQQSDIKAFTGAQSYDFIFTNPPFFENDLKSPDHSRNKALHDITLTLDDLLSNLYRLIKPSGVFSILLPYYRSPYFKQLCLKQDWHCYKQINIQQTDKHDFFRSILFFTKKKSTPLLSSLTIKHSGNYSESFRALLKEYYLHL